MQRPILSQGNHAFSERSHCLGFGQSCLDALVLNQAANLVRQQRLSMLGGAPELNRLFLVSHEKGSGLSTDYG